MLGMLEVNILTINGVEGKTRGMLLESDDDEKIRLLGEMLGKSQQHYCVRTAST